MSRDPYPVDPHDDRSDASGRSNSHFDSQPQVDAGSIEPAAIPASDLRAADRATSNHRIPEALDSPRAHYTRERTYFLRDSELETLTEVGTFRVIAAPDLAHFGYGGDTARMEREIRRLKQSVVAIRKTWTGCTEQTIPIVGPDQARFTACPKIGTRV